MYIIIGLGNPGQEYANTRHNVGFMVVDRLKKLGWPKSKCLLVKLQTFMNRSGEGVKKVLASAVEKSPNDYLSRLWLIHDDLDLPLGTIRINFGGSSAGHHGVQSIIEELGDDQFWRIRVGIGRPVGKSGTSERSEASYVLSPFDKIEQPLVTKVIEQTAQMVLSNLKKGSIVNETFHIDE